MKLSIVIPVFNAEAFIDASYSNILNQELDNFEILYIDNNSVDQSVEIINTIVAKDKRVKLLHQKKPGAAATRNKGIINAKGSYIYVFDVDDAILPGALKSLIEVLDKHLDMDAVFGKMIKSSKLIHQTEIPNDASGKVIFKPKPYWGMTWFFDLRTVVGPPAFLYRKEVFVQIGLYNESIKNNEDTAFDIKLGMTSNVAHLDQYVYLYYKHSNSTIETTKKTVPRPVMIWPRLVKEHLPFVLNNLVPRKFEWELYNKLYQSMGRQLLYQTTYKKRYGLMKQLIDQIDVLYIPFTIRLSLFILICLPFESVKKVYSYYIVPHAIKHTRIK